MTSSGKHAALAMLTALAVAACAARPLRLYTLNDAAAMGPPGELRPGAPVVEVDRLILPDYLDTVDILLRRGSVLERSDGARWASRLSILATNLLTARLATRAPDALVTDQWRGTVPDYRIMVQVTRLDVTSAGVASLNAYWQIIPRDRQLQAVRNRTQIRITGPVATDQEVVALETELFERLARAIRLPYPAFPTGTSGAPQRCSLLARRVGSNMLGAALDYANGHADGYQGVPAGGGVGQLRRRRRPAGRIHRNGQQARDERRAAARGTPPQSQ